MNASDIISLVNVVAQFTVAGVAIWAVLASLHANKKQIEENRRLATEERQHQSCPIIIPLGAIPHAMNDLGQVLYTQEPLSELKGNIQWGLQNSNARIQVMNIGTGPAFNIHCVLYGSDSAYENQFVSWNNGPIGHGTAETIYFRHPLQDEFYLERNDSIDGKHPLYYPFTGPNPNRAQACLTISYQDLFDNKLISIFDYTTDHRWVRVFVSIPSSPKIALDLKELNDLKESY